MIKMYMMGIPLSYTKTPPEDQSPCIIEQCPICNCDMWMSEKKRAKRDANKDCIICYCGHCIMKDMISKGINPEEVEFYDILKTQ